MSADAGAEAGAFVNGANTRRNTLPSHDPPPAGPACAAAGPEAIAATPVSVVATALMEAYSAAVAADDGGAPAPADMVGEASSSARSGDLSEKCGRFVLWPLSMGGGDGLRERTAVGAAAAARAVEEETSAAEVALNGGGGGGGDGGGEAAAAAVAAVVVVVGRSAGCGPCKTVAAARGRGGRSG